MTTASNKRRRQNKEEEQCQSCAKRKKKHLYLALYERKRVAGGWQIAFSIHKLDPDTMESEYDDDDDDRLPEPAVRFEATELAPMAVAAVGTSIFVATSPHLSISDTIQAEEVPAPPTFVYDTETATLTIGPRLPHGYLEGAKGVPTAVGDDRLYALTMVYDDELRRYSSYSLQVLARTPTRSSWVDSETIMAWSWNNNNGDSSAPPPDLGRGRPMTSYAVHPDGRTIFMSTREFTWSFDTGSNGVWKEIGPWSLPFTGQAYFDGDLDAWVGLRHSDEHGYDVCCCRVPSLRSRSATATTTRPECKMLKNKLFLRRDEDYSIRMHHKATLTYMGESRFCLVENVSNSSRDRFDPTATLHVTLFGLTYDRNGELCTRVRYTTKYYAVSVSLHTSFSHAAFWM